MATVHVKETLMEIFFLVAIISGIVLVWAFRVMTRRAFMRNRQPEDLALIYKTIQGQVSAKVFDEVWSKIGDSYGIDPKLLRPDDSLKSLSDVDSWDLGSGGDQITEWLRGKGLQDPPPLVTLLDLAIWVESRQTFQGGPATA